VIVVPKALSFNTVLVSISCHQTLMHSTATALGVLQL